MAYEQGVNKEETDKVSETCQKALLHILEEIEKEDDYIRQRLLREAKQNELYWHQFQYLFWDERVQDYRIPTQDVIEQFSSREEIKFIYDYVVNIFKAHGLSIIAALSAEIPGVPFSPMNAESAEDKEAAQQAEELGKIIQRSNRAKLIFYHALFTLYTNHYVVAYNCFKRNKDKYGGVIEIPKFEKKKSKGPDSYSCPGEDCDFESEEKLQECPHCGGPLDYKEGEEIENLEKVGVDEVERGMEEITIKGTLNWKIPLYASNQDACGYAIEYCDAHYAWLRKNFPSINREKLTNRGATDNFEKIARMPSTGGMYSDSYTQSLLTLKRVWLRPWMYDLLNDENEIKELNEKYPSGVYFAAVDCGSMEFAEGRPEMLDDHITITKGDLSRTIHGDPLGKPLIPLQDLENMVANLLTESLEHSVPSTFADPEILDFEVYSKQEVLPGMVYPSKTSLTNPNRTMEDYFYTMKTSTLPKEGVDFDRIVESKAQFVVGAFPSIFGGPQTQGSKTLGEYQESRGYALQRLSIPYQLLFFWWADVIYKCVKDYIKNMVADEKHTIQITDKKFDTVELLKDSFAEGRFELLIPEAATDLPVSYSQKRTTLQQMVQLNSDILNEFLFSPENRAITLRYLGLEELTDLDGNETMKQLVEIEQLLKEEPIIGPDGMEAPSVPVEMDIDDPEIHLRVIKSFAAGRSGRWHKKNNPNGYKNMLLHGKAHKMLMMQEMMMQQGPPPETPGKVPPKIPAKTPPNNGGGGEQ